MNYLEPYNFYFNLPIYTPITITSENEEALNDLLSAKDKRIDGYHPYLKENTTYSISAFRSLINESRYFYSSNAGGAFCILTCLRAGEKFFFFIDYDKEKGIFQKIGQFPSIATFHINQIKKYDKVLSGNRLKEFTRAIGLAANGVGIGSFVYLRRIFEALIEEAHEKAKADNNWDEDTYQRQRMTEKIEMLKLHLPTFLVENKSLYGILSIGVHELKEKDCLEHFETVKIGIELILDEKVEQFEKDKKIAEAKQKISALTQKIKKEQ